MTQPPLQWTAYSKVNLRNSIQNFLYVFTFIRISVLCNSDVNYTTKLSFLGYVLCPAEQRFMLLYTFLKKNIGKKVMVRLSLLFLICAWHVENISVYVGTIIEP